MLKGQSAANPLMPNWVDPTAELPFVSTVTGSAPITVDNTVTTTPIIGFDVNTTSLTKYVPNSAFTATSTLLVGGGVGTYNTLAPGNNGQVLSVTDNGSLAWVDPPNPGADINLTPADDSVVMSPNPITGTGTIGVTPGKYIETVTIQNKGDMIYGDASGNPARLAAGTAGQMIVMNASGVPVWVTDLDSGAY